MSKIKPIVVIGLMGSGKSTVSRLLADALGLPVTDSDAFLRARTGLTAAEIAVRHGADVLHEHEAEHILEALNGPKKIIAAAASTVERADVRKAMKAAYVVWLDADPAVLAERMRSSAHRPPFDPAAMRAGREPYFRQVADLTCDVATMTAQQIAETICRRLEAAGS